MTGVSKSRIWAVFQGFTFPENDPGLTIEEITAVCDRHNRLVRLTLQELVNAGLIVATPYQIQSASGKGHFKAGRPRLCYKPLGDILPHVTC